MKKSERKETLREMCREGDEKSMLKNMNDMINTRYKKYVDNIGMKQKKEINTIEMKHTKQLVENIGHKGHYDERYYTGENRNKTCEIGASVHKSRPSEKAIEIVSDYNENIRIIEKNLDMIMEIKKTIENLEKLNLDANKLIGDGKKVDLKTEGTTIFLKLAGIGEEQVSMSEYMKNIQYRLKEFFENTDDKLKFNSVIDDYENEKFKEANLKLIEINTHICVNVLSLIFFEDGKGISDGDKLQLKDLKRPQYKILKHCPWYKMLTTLGMSNLAGINTEKDRILLYEEISNIYIDYLDSIKNGDTDRKSYNLTTLLKE
jgi:hypothetical protein